MAEIEWTHEAKSWLQQIYVYIARDNEEAAWQVIPGIGNGGLSDGYPMNQEEPLGAIARYQSVIRCD